MVSEVPGSDSSGPYKPSYQLEGKAFTEWKGFWEHLFRDKVDLSKDDVHKMTDVFVNFISHQMGHVLDHALKMQKALRRSAETGEAPEPIS